MLMKQPRRRMNPCGFHMRGGIRMCVGQPSGFDTRTDQFRMGPRSHFLLWGAVLVVIAIMAGSFLANVMALGRTVPIALGQAVNALFNGIAIFVLYVPVALIGLISAAIVKRRSIELALVAFVVGVAPLTYMYAAAHWDAAIAMSQSKWTAAALSIGLFSFLGLIWAATVGFLVWLLLKSAKRSS